MKDFKTTYAGQSVFLTGHTGFKGSWMALWLSQLGASVHGYSLPAPTDPSNFAVSRIEDAIASHTVGDIRDLDKMTAALRQAKPRFVFHLAAQPLVRLSYREPRETYETNVMGTVNLLEAVRAYAAETNEPVTCVVITSDKCYENREHVWGYRECDAMGGHDPYSCSKGVAELVTSSYRRSFFDPAHFSEHGVKLASARAGNVIGGGDWALDRIVTDIVRTLAAGDAVPVRNPKAIRPWQHVLEPISGYMTLAAAMADSEPKAEGAKFCDGWNFGPRSGDERCVGDLVEEFISAWGSGSWDDLSDPNALHEAKILRLSIDKAVSILNWRPRWDFPETISRTANWYRLYHETRAEGASMREACLEDIAAYTGQLTAEPAQV
ncbi:MAG: CDP-glucose 4,6-dehydratase [Sumerlaeia bacterium]